MILSEYDTADHYETILKNIRDGVYTLDPHGKITWVNETAVEEFNIGYDREELIGSSVSKVLDDEDIEKCIAIIQECLNDNQRESGRCEITLQTASGAGIPCDLHLAMLPFSDGEFQGTVGVVREISDQKLREQQLEVQARVLRHNLRNDINIIFSNAESLQQDLEGESLQKVETILQVCDDLIEVSEKANKLSKIGKWANSDPVQIDMLDRIEEIIRNFQTEFVGVEFEVITPEEEEIRGLVGSTEIFDLAVRNIIENSIQHNEADIPHIRIETTIDDGLSKVHITDNGPGLPSMERMVFENAAEDPLQHSNGLGLWLAYWCVTGVGGGLSFDNDRQNGTMVTLEFPAG